MIVGRPSTAKALADALKKATTSPEDAAAVAMARQYAELIDNAAPKAVYRRHLAALYDADLDEDQREAFDRIAEALAAHSVASDLGPKLLAVLVELRMTPKARAAALKGDDPGTNPAKSALDELRARRKNRGLT